MTDNKQTRKKLERTNNYDIRIENTVHYNDQGIHHDRSEAEHRYEFGVELGRNTDLHYYLRFTR
jgi:hypothetical protein